MAKQSIDLAFKQTERYKEMAAIIRREAGQNTPDYLIDLCIWYHMSHPLAYKQKRNYVIPEKEKVPQVIEGDVHVM